MKVETTCVITLDAKEKKELTTALEKIDKEHSKIGLINTTLEQVDIDIIKNLLKTIK